MRDQSCVFPFTYKDETYTSCTDRTDPDDLLWCATKVDPQGNYIKGNWGYCDTDSDSDCEGDQEEFDSQVNSEEESDSLTLRSTNVYGRTCFSSGGYSGSCRRAKYCKGSNYSYSRTCGWTYVCCKRSPNPRSKVNFPTSSPRTTTRRPSRRTTTTKRPKLPPAPLCGLEGSEPFVFGGQLAKPGQFPFMVSFVYTDRSADENFCGGVMITSRHVLTAAHCFKGRPESEWKGGLVDVRIGLNNLQSREKTGNSANIAKVTLNPDYEEVAGGKEGVVNDLTIVTLDRDVKSPSVCLPETARSRNQTAVVIGFGKINRGKGGRQQSQLRFAYLDEIDTRTCQRKYNDFYKRSKHKPRITREMICAGNSDADACSGDSGGPLLYLNRDLRWMVAGVVSFGPSSCGNKAPGVYARVDRHLDWIRAETRS